MPVAFSVALRACCVLVALILATARAAEQSSSLIGATRDQVLARHGEPRSQIASGDRVIFFYARERIVLRDGIVTAVEPIASESPRRPPADPPVSPQAPLGVPSAGPAPPGDSPPTGPSTSPSSQSAPPAPESKLEIKLVRPPSSKDARPVPGSAVPPPSPEPVTPKASPVGPAPEKTVPGSSPAMTKSLEVPPPAGPSPGAIFEPPVATDTSSTRQAEALAAAAEKETKAKAAKAARRRLDEAEASEPAESVFTGRTLVFAVVIIGVGVGVLIWRYRQRQLELAATTVLSTPLSLPVAPTKSSGAVFTADLLNKLDWKRFEGLVAAYYSKTGVVALRTNTGPESAVHIKISWKGEPRPFAYVRCIAHPSALVDAKPVQDLIAALAAEDIRRGYVVTAGKFNVAARDVAEEKHITLLPGDIFLEKLNDLPASARSEVMQAIDGGD